MFVFECFHSLCAIHLLCTLKIKLRTLAIIELCKITAKFFKSIFTTAALLQKNNVMLTKVKYMLIIVKQALYVDFSFKINKWKLNKSHKRCLKI